MKTIIFLIYILISPTIFADVGKVTGYDLPRFVSLKSNVANLRVGPSINYPIQLRYTQKNYPLEVIDEFDTWRKIKDHQGNKGWLHKSLIKGDRNVLSFAKSENGLGIYNRPNGKVIGLVKSRNILKLNICLKNWCNIEIEKIKGWVLKEDIWGVYPNEIFNKKFYQHILDLYWKILDSNFFDIKK